MTQYKDVLTYMFELVVSLGKRPTWRLQGCPEFKKAEFLVNLLKLILKLKGNCTRNYSRGNYEL